MTEPETSEQEGNLRMYTGGMKSPHEHAALVITFKHRNETNGDTVDGP